MTLWDQLKREVLAGSSPTAPGGDFDGPRRKRLRAVSDITGRPLIIYVADFLNKGKVQAVRGDVLIDLEDIEGFKETMETIAGRVVDVLVQSPGGSAEAAESIVELLRTRFQEVRFLIPGVAKSAATMLVMSGDILLLDNSSELWSYGSSDGHQ